MRRIPHPSSTGITSTRIRSKRANIMLLALCIFSAIVLPLFLAGFQMGWLALERSTIQSVVDASNLVAANDLSRLIINDPNFGYVSLSNYPPIGKATCAADGEPLPVIGYNTLTGTIRQNAIIAREINNDGMAKSVATDRIALTETKNRLNATLRNAIGPGSSGKYRDIFGEPVNIDRDVRQFLSEHLPSNIHLSALEIANGSLHSGGRTCVSLPTPRKLANVSRDDEKLGEYRPFINIPFEREAYTFAGVSTTSNLCNLEGFERATNDKVCSIVRIDCTVTIDNPFPFPFLFGLSRDSSQIATTLSSCAEPFCNADIGPPGVMTLRFPSGSVTGIQSWNDLMATEGFHDNEITSYEVTGGDYPSDSAARMQQTQLTAPQNTNQLFGEHLYCWLRNGHLHPHIDKVFEMLAEPFQKSDTSSFYVYEFDRSGGISRKSLANDPFPAGVTADSQTSFVANTNTQAGANAIIVFRNDTKTIGTTCGGKHAGQPLAGYPLNWCELQDFGGDERLAQIVGKGKLGLQLTLAGSNNSSEQTAPALFQTANGSQLFLQPRKTYYSGGLALDIEIGGMRVVNPNDDVAMMQAFTSRRRI